MFTFLFDGDDGDYDGKENDGGARYVDWDALTANVTLLDFESMAALWKDGSPDLLFSTLCGSWLLW